MVVKKSFGREMAMLCAPLVIIGALLGWNSWQKRRRTPNVALRVRVVENSSPLPETFYSKNFMQQLKWEALLEGGPQEGYRLGWSEQLVAQTSRGPIVVWRREQPAGIWETKSQRDAPARKGAWQNNAWSALQGSSLVTSGFDAGAGLNSAFLSGTYWINEIWPADTKSVEWRAEFVAIAADSDQLWYSPVPATDLREWAKAQGAATWKRAIPLEIEPRKLRPVLLLKQRSSVQDRDLVDVSVLPRAGNWRSFRRLVAFDGKTRRTLWTSAEKDSNRHYYVGGGSQRGGGVSTRQSDLFTFDMEIIPASWGEVTFLCDTVFTFDPNAPAFVAPRRGPDQNAVAQFEKSWNGLRDSSRLTLRADKAKAPR